MSEFLFCNSKELPQKLVDLREHDMDAARTMFNECAPLRGLAMANEQAALESKAAAQRKHGGTAKEDDGRPDAKDQRKAMLNLPEMSDQAAKLLDADVMDILGYSYNKGQSTGFLDPSFEKQN